MDLNDVKAGKYQLVAVRWDQITSEPGKPLDYIRHRRGDIVELNAADARRLVKAGAVVKPGQLEKNAAEEARALAERAAADYQAILAGLPEDVRAEIAPGTVPQTPGSPAPGSGSDEKPATDASIELITAYVGDDKDRAAEFLTAEQGKGESARATLVKKLQSVADGGGS
ncbi:hypothetical protein [Nocardioides lianchengensis]|uniref:Uncharacterized protein n=1 Tax=Nocardioides lianchengensis TaxID=1045774 RepID=A0A1G6LRX0_9ACTN|nr:hypothetical protein [Nocardioides lianchengensis]NYG12463.1 hypothetical protein [Nocardioides lianchengensis]SDC45990.1 hypothetical protein SAMN05421872_102341 [Nocardioides lianchengensis]